MKKLLIGLALLTGVISAPAITVDSTVSDHCVLQQNMKNTVKGKTTAGNTVTVTFGGEQKGTAKADSAGNFSVKFNPGAASATARELVVSDSTGSVTVSDVLVGEVWFVAGQSNAFNMMDPQVMNQDYATAYPSWKAQFECPNLRVVISTPTQNAGGMSDYYKAAPSQPLRWIVCRSSNESDVKKISPLAFFFGKKLSAYKNCPVGIVLVGKGGTPIGYHMTAEASALAKQYYGGDYTFGDGFSNNLNFSDCYTRTDTVAARGVVWAEGESVGGVGGTKYRFLLRAFVENWRSRRNDANFPFIIYGLANIDDSFNEGPKKWPRIRWEQEMAVAGLIPHTALFHAIDLSGSKQKGYAKSIHPDQKPELADRALLAARNLVYGENVAYRCPYPIEAHFNSDRTKIIVTFPYSVSLTMTGSYTHIPFRLTNGNLDQWKESTGPTSVQIGADGHSLEISAPSTFAFNPGDKSNTIEYCNVADTEDETYAYEQRIKDQNGFPMPPFIFNISNNSSVTGARTATVPSPSATQAKAVKTPAKPENKPVTPTLGTGSGNAVQLWENGPYWATKNIGAASEADCGTYFSWSSTTGYAKGATTKFNGGCVTMNKSVSDLSAYLDANGNLKSAYDAASVNMGGSWRMPTFDELSALVANCDATWDSDLQGTHVRGRGKYAGKEIFLPNPGYYQDNGFVINLGIYGFYLSSTPNSNSTQARAIVLQAVAPLRTSNANRNNGYCVRAVSTANPGSGTGSGTSSRAAISNSRPAASSPNAVKSSSGTAKTNSSTAKPSSHASVSSSGTASSQRTAGTSGTNARHEGVQLWANGPYWATMNCGATKIGQPGSYYAGPNDTTGLSVRNGALTGLLAKNTATTIWGGGWRIPTESDFRGLISNTEYLGTENIDGQLNIRLCGKTPPYKKNIILIPIAGWGNGGSVSAAPNCWGTWGKYWGSTPNGGFMRNLQIIPGNFANNPASWMQIVNNHAQVSNIYSVRMCCDSITPADTRTHSGGPKKE